MGEMSEEEYRSRVFANFVVWLAEQYKAGDVHERCRLAGLCDERFDRSGQLLGRIRNLA